jgi:glyoxylase-like metal-dependent hydrolase (beta-lactamase superfamily II)
MARIDVISIGTLERNRLWNETAAVRQAHVTTSLIRAGKRHILVNPSLPPQALLARLNERTGLDPFVVDTIFLTSFASSHRNGLTAFPNARILMWEPEVEYARQQVSELVESSPDDEELSRAADEAMELLERVEAAPDQMLEGGAGGGGGGIDLFPLPGQTSGTAGLLVTSATLTTLVAGDAIPSLDHFLAAQVLPDAADIEQAQESLREAYEIADVIVPGRDNLFLNPRMQGVG